MHLCIILISDILELSMLRTEIKRYLLDIILFGICYALIFAGLMYFVYPIESRNVASFSELIATTLGSAFFYGAFSGLFTGTAASFWVNRRDYRSSITIGLYTGIFSAILGSIFFPIFGAVIRVLYFGINPVDYGLEIAFLVNLSIIGIFPGIFVCMIAGIVAGIIAADFGKTLGA
jgi:hypothetical protein